MSSVYVPLNDKTMSTALDLFLSEDDNSDERLLSLYRNVLHSRPSALKHFEHVHSKRSKVSNIGDERKISLLSEQNEKRKPTQGMSLSAITKNMPSTAHPKQRLFKMGHHQSTSNPRKIVPPSVNTKSMNRQSSTSSTSSSNSNKKIGQVGTTASSKKAAPPPNAMNFLAALNAKQSVTRSNLSKQRVDKEVSVKPEKKKGSTKTNGKSTKPSFSKDLIAVSKSSQESKKGRRAIKNENVTYSIGDDVLVHSEEEGRKFAAIVTDINEQTNSYSVEFENGEVWHDIDPVLMEPIEN